MAQPLNVLITGCSDGGLGAGLALAFAAHTSPPVRVIATLRTPSKAASLASHPNILVLPLDVTSPSSVKALVHALDERDIALDVVVANAGVHYPGPILDVDVDGEEAEGATIAQDVFEANVWGYVRTLKALVPAMARSGRGGMVVTIGSCADIVPTPFAGIYTASKAAMGAIAETLAAEVEPFGIQHLLVRLGAVLSNIATNGTQNLPLSLQPNPPSSVPSTLYTAHLPAIRARLALSQTDPSALTSRQAADAIVARVFAGYRPSGVAPGWGERIRSWIGLAARPEKDRQTFRGGSMLLGRVAWMLWLVRMILPRQLGLRFVARRIMRAGSASKKVD